ncbi:hypothetical protein C8J56DRAFT_1037731 [Mycena floridula]|nr:hypothetical protein C8J56DRAFT_1037731 [Mycena floridula]
MPRSRRLSLGFAVIAQLTLTPFGFYIHLIDDVLTSSSIPLSQLPGNSTAPHLNLFSLGFLQENRTFLQYTSGSPFVSLIPPSSNAQIAATNKLQTTRPISSSNGQFTPSISYRFFAIAIPRNMLHCLMTAHEWQSFPFVHHNPGSSPGWDVEIIAVFCILTPSNLVDLCQPITDLGHNRSIAPCLCHFLFIPFRMQPRHSRDISYIGRIATLAQYIAHEAVASVLPIRDGGWGDTRILLPVTLSEDAGTLVLEGPRKKAGQGIIIIVSSDFCIKTLVLG